jgi:hypothetical protein
MNIMGTLKTAGGLARKAGNVLGHSIMGQYGRTAQGAVVGGLWGGVLGGVNRDGSMLGGATKGAALGAAFGRYGRAPMDVLERFNPAYGMEEIAKRFTGKGAKNIGAFTEAYSMAYAKAVGNQVRRDSRSITMAANKGYNRIKGIFQ